MVEGRYDVNTLRQIVDTVILTTDGFGIFKNAQKRSLLQTLAKQRGLIILTDGDSAGFVIRNHLKGVLPTAGVKHAYIPDVAGKEKRKKVGGKEGKMGVEGMSREILERALRQAGATIVGDVADSHHTPWLTKADLYELGLSGGLDASLKRKKLLKILDFPEHMTTNALLDLLNALYTPDAFATILEMLAE